MSDAARYLVMVNHWPHWYRSIGEALCHFDRVLRPARKWDPVNVTRQWARDADGRRYGQMNARLPNGIPVTLQSYPS